MKRKMSGRMEAVYAAGFILVCLICLWSICGGIRVQAAQPSGSQDSHMLSEPEAAPSGNDLTVKPDRHSSSEEGSIVQNWNITATPIHYGQALKNSALSGNPVDAQGNRVKGSFSWSDPEKVMTTVGNIPTVVVFTPETETEDGKIQYGEPYSISFWITVERAVPVITEWCKINCSDVIYDGDTLEEKTTLQSGQAVYENTAEKKAVRASKTVSGKFVWKDAAQKLTAGTISCELTFVPDNENLYQPVSTTVELEVLPRPVGLKLELSEKTVTTEDEILLTASIEKTRKLQTLDGRIIFYANDEAIDEKMLTENENGWSAELSWKAEAAGDYAFQAEYIPADTHTAGGKSGKINATVVEPLSELITEELPSGREEKAYEAQLKTNASGKLKLLFKLEEGALPEGLVLNESSGEITGTPKESGEFVFTASATEKNVTKQKEYRLVIEEKLVFSVKCDDISYGEALNVRTEVSPDREFRSSCAYEGRNDTVYERSDTPPSAPGDYRVIVKIEEPADYAGLELYQNFTVRKAVPKLSVTAKPETLNGGGDCTISIILQNPVDSSLTENLPADIGVSFDKDVEITQALSGENGRYTLVFRAKPQNAEIRFSVSVEANSCYESAQISKNVTVTQKETSEDDSTEEEQPLEKPSSSGGHSAETENEAEVTEKTEEEVEAEFWQDVIFRIYKAQDNAETVTINAKGHGSMPDKVMDALRKHEKVTLALVWEGDMIVIFAGKALPYEKEHKTWTLAELSRRYPLNAAAPPSGQVETAPPETVQQPQPSGQTAAAQTPLNHPASVPDSQNPTEADPGQTVQTEASSEEAETESEKTGLTEMLQTVETIAAMEEVPEGSTVDWFLVAAGVCAVCGVLVVALAVAALTKGKRRNGD